MSRLFYRLSDAAKGLSQTENGVLQLSATGKLPAYILTGGFFAVPRWIVENDHMDALERFQFERRVLRKLGIKNNMARIADFCVREFITGDYEITAFIDNRAFSYTAQNGENKCGLLGFDLCYRTTPVTRDNPVKLKDCELVFKPADIENLRQSMPQTLVPSQQHGEDSSPRQNIYKCREADCDQWIESGINISALTDADILKQLKRRNQKLWGALADSSFRKEFWTKYSRKRDIKKKPGPKAKQL